MTDKPRFGRPQTDLRLGSQCFTECRDEWGNLYSFWMTEVDGRWHMVYVGRGYDNTIYHDVSVQVPYMLCKGFKSVRIGIISER